MTKAKLKKFENLLLDLDSRLRGDISALEDQARTATGGQSTGSLSNTPIHLAHVGTEAYMQELNATLLGNEEYIHSEVITAFHRIEAGTYGDCERCQKPILEERLELLPYTRYCTACSAEVQDGHPANLNEGRMSDSI